MFMTWSERLKAEGEREALRRLLVQFLERRFAPVPPLALRRVESMKSIPRLYDLIEKVMTVSSLQELRLVAKKRQAQGS
jgi:hypothetical protein